MQPSQVHHWYCYSMVKGTWGRWGQSQGAGQCPQTAQDSAGSQKQPQMIFFIIFFLGRTLLLHHIQPNVLCPGQGGRFLGSGWQKLEDPWAVLWHGTGAEALKNTSEGHPTFSLGTIKTSPFTQTAAGRRSCALETGNAEDCMAVTHPAGCHHLQIAWGIEVFPVTSPWGSRDQQALSFLGTIPISLCSYGALQRGAGVAVAGLQPRAENGHGSHRTHSFPEWRTCPKTCLCHCGQSHGKRALCWCLFSEPPAALDLALQFPLPC